MLDDFRTLPAPLRVPKCGNNTLLQFLAHAYFISSGLWLWSRWFLRHLLRLGPSNPTKERTGLVRRFQTYLTLLKHWGIIQLEFVGFEEAASWQGSVIAPNHPSILDVLLVMTSIPSLNCVMNAKLLNHPVTAGGALLCHFIQNNSLLQMIRSCKENLNTGTNVLIFPEGTRTTIPPLGPFHDSYVLAAKSANAPIRTIIIECDSEYFGRKFSYFQPAQCPMRFRVTAGKVFQTTPSTNARTLSAEIENYFRASLVEAS
jgi:1-acyl-sn-glycerol-3-phosphate acyltransferase